MTSFIDLIQQRRSCRLYEEKPVTQEQIETLKKALLWAPTSKNNRPWEFVFVTNADTLKQLSLAKPHGANFMASAPLAVVILADPAKSDVGLKTQLLPQPFCRWPPKTSDWAVVGSRSEAANTRVAN
jgi:Nitroreductase